MKEQWRVMWLNPQGGWIPVGLPYTDKVQAIVAVIKYNKLFPNAEYKVEKDTS